MSSFCLFYLADCGYNNRNVFSQQHQRLLDILEEEKEVLSRKLEEALMQQSKKHKVLLLFTKKRGLICTTEFIGNDPVTIIDRKRKLSQALWPFEMIFSHSSIVYCSLIFHNVYRKCLTNVWMKKDKEVRRLWQLLQRYVLLSSRHAMWIPCVSLQMPSSATHFIIKFVKLCYHLCLKEASSVNHEHICYILCLNTDSLCNFCLR